MFSILQYTVYLATPIYLGHSVWQTNFELEKGTITWNNTLSNSKSLFLQFANYLENYWENPLRSLETYSEIFSTLERLIPNRLPTWTRIIDSVNKFFLEYTYGWDTGEWESIQSIIFGMGHYEKIWWSNSWNCAGGFLYYPSAKCKSPRMNVSWGDTLHSILGWLYFKKVYEAKIEWTDTRFQVRR